MSSSAVTQQGAVQQPVLSFDKKVAIPMGYDPCVIGELVGIGHVVVGSGKLAINFFDLAFSGVGSLVTPRTLRGKCKERLSGCVAGMGEAVKMVARGAVEIIPLGGCYLKERDKRHELQKELKGLLKNLEQKLAELNASQKSVAEAKQQLSDLEKKLSELDAVKNKISTDKDKLTSDKNALEEEKASLQVELSVHQDALQAKTREIEEARRTIQQLNEEKTTVKKTGSKRQ